MLLPGPLHSNLTCGGSDIDDETLIQQLEMVQLWDLVASQGGLDANAADLKLSCGQRQLMCMAWALTRRHESAVLVLDEAMSTVDRNTEALMVRILEEQFAEHTVISVVNRLNTVEKFEAVLLMDAGEVVEAGAPAAKV